MQIISSLSAACQLNFLITIITNDIFISPFIFWASNSIKTNTELPEEYVNICAEKTSYNFIAICSIVYGQQSLLNLNQ